MTLYTVNQFADKYPCFPRGGLRYYLFNSKLNGLESSGAIKRIGRKIFIDEVKFFDWVDNLNMGERYEA